jgi:glycosyltransferase involved in cell wall biosynthesis
MNREVIGMPVAPAGVVAGHHIGLFVIEDSGDLASHHSCVYACKAIVLRVQPGVAVAEGHYPRDPQRGSGYIEFIEASSAEVRRERGVRQPCFTIGGDYEDHSVALPGRARHRARGEEGLIIGVGVAEHQGAGHRYIVPYGQDVRIVHISDCYLPRLGGIEVQLRSLALQQRAAGHDVTILTATPGHAGVHAGRDEVDGIVVYRIAASIPGEIPVHPRGGRLITDTLHRLGHDGPIDAVHVHSGVVSPFAWQGIRAATRLRVPTLVTVHCVWGPGAQPAYRLANGITHWSKWGAQIATVSEMSAERIRPVVRPDDVLVLPNGIDPSMWQVETGPPEPDKLRVVAVMRLAPRKRSLPLVKVLAEASRQLAPDLHLSAVVIGDGPQLSSARKAAAGIDVDFVGRLDRDGIKSVFARSDVFIQSSVRESFGLAALEARTAGLPVIARSQTGIREFVESGVEGLLAPDDAGLARALVSVGRDPSQLLAMSAHNRSTAPAQNWPKVLELTDLAYVRATALMTSHA